MIYWIWLSQLEGIGSCIHKLLLKYFQTPERIYHSELDELLECDGIGKERAQQIIRSKGFYYRNMSRERDRTGITFRNETGLLLHGQRNY